MQTFKEKALRSSCRYECIRKVIRLVAGRRERKRNCILHWNECPVPGCKNVRDKSYWSMFINSKCSFSAWGDRRLVSSLTLTSRLRCCHVSLLVKKERIQAWLLPPGLPPSSAMLVDEEEWENFEILVPGQLLAEVAGLSDWGGQGQDLSLQTQLHFRACIGQLELPSGKACAPPAWQ